MIGPGGCAQLAQAGIEVGSVSSVLSQSRYEHLKLAVVEAGGFAPPSEDVRPKACYVA